MGDLTPHEIESLILGYEELDAEDKALADAYLSRLPELAARLRWHQEKEAAALGRMADAEAMWDDTTLDAADEEASQESLRRLLALVENRDRQDQSQTSSGGRILSFTDRMRHQARWVLPLAAVLATVVFLGRQKDVSSLLMENLHVAQLELLADGSRGSDQIHSSDGVLHTGDAFALDFYLSNDAYVVVYHVSPAGQVSRVYPEAITDSLSPHSGGQGHQIPGPDEGEAWVLGTQTGTETFLVASSKTLPLDLVNFAVPDSTKTRDRILAEMKSRLAEVMDQVDVYEFTHVD